MIVPDVSLLVYAHNEADPDHAAARRWWEDLLSGVTPVGLPWVSAAGFVRLMTHPRVLADPMPVAHATLQVRRWLERPNVIVLQPGARFGELFFGYLERLGAAGNLTTDAQLAALAVEHQAELHSADADFARFPGLRWRNPLR
jgi:toxin-antitoxin system PIN domain toxin